MKSYEKGRLPQIIWGSKSADRVGTELKSADVQKCLLVSGSHVIKHPITQKIIHSLESLGIVCDVFDRVLPEPTDSLCIEIAQEIKHNHYDCILGIGGGSPMDAAKAASLIAGIPEEILVEHKEDCVRISMIGDIRSLNLGNSVAIVLYEALRQNGFAGMNLEGHLHELHW